MANFEIIMPKLGESIIEATITRWLKKPGDMIEEDDPIVEIATDKVDSEIPSPVEGRLIKALFKEGDIVPVGIVIAIIDLSGGEISAEAPDTGQPKEVPAAVTATPVTVDAHAVKTEGVIEEPVEEPVSDSGKFYSPLVKSIAKTEKVSAAELDGIRGSGKEGRVTKDDLLEYLKSRQAKPPVSAAPPAGMPAATPPSRQAPSPVVAGAGDTIIEMDRMRRLIADHMVMSKQVSPHVTSYIEVDMTPIVQWRDKVKEDFIKRENQKITFTPIIIEATAQALREYPNVNASVEGYNVIQRKNVNIGMAAALPNGNLIVPVIKNADQKNLLGLARDVNTLADRARRNKLDPDDVMGGTFTITNFGTFNSLTGSPIINQPQVAILGVGVIKKRPVVLETASGDVIAIRHIMILSLSYDHRVVDGALGGMFLKRVTELLENFDTSRTI
jgi:2-oxoglutarate dehydrogenase E2 component (dihydrolipoamide succinyltransferase)